jgi:hypothetical protein
LPDGIGNPTPGHRAVVIVGRELVGAGGAFLVGALVELLS